MAGDRLSRVTSLIDAANAQDPESVDAEGEKQPAALLYSRRMSRVLETFAPNASEALRIAVKAQHLERWKLPRDSYTDGRAGYLAWRTAAARHHAERTGEMMAQAGYANEEIARVASLIRKQRLKRDPEAQVLEDVACLVFLEYYAETFIAKHDDAKVRDILAKTARKMSPDGLAAAGALSLPARLARLLRQAVAA